MRCICLLSVFGVLAFSLPPALADGLQIDQNASVNFSFVTVTRPDSSTIQINQAGHTNVISGAQLAPDLNHIETNQSGSFNTVVIYQDGFIDIARVTQYGPDGPQPETNLPTTYNVRETEAGFLATFNSGDVSIATLTSPDFTYISHFGRRH